MSRICLISYHFSETTIPLARYLGLSGYSVDFIYIKDFSSAFEHPGLDLSNIVLRVGLNRVVLNKKNEFHCYLAEAGVAFYVFVLPPLRHKLPFLTRLAFRALALYVRLKRFNTFHVIGHDQFLISLIRSLPPERLVVTFHEVCDHSATSPALFSVVKFCLQQKARIIVHSRFISEVIRSLNGDGRVWIVPFGPFETYRFWGQSSGINNSEVPAILFFGNLLPYKGLDVLAGALRILKGRGLHIPCTIAGNGSAELLSEFNGLTTHIIRRRLTNNELVSLIKSSYAVVCPYKSASQSGVIMTAFQFGRPVIVSNLAGLAEVVEHGRTGLLVDPCNSVALAEAIELLVSDSVLYSEMRKSVDSIATTADQTWMKIAQSTISIYEK